MSQVTIYLEPELASKMRLAAESEGVSQSRWVARLVRERLSTEWPEGVLELEGEWADFPEADELRESLGQDLPREQF